MKSRISWCNTTVLRKNFTRFAPAWVLYGVLMLMLFITDAVGYKDKTGLASSLCYSMPTMAQVNFMYALLCAQLLFGDLFNSRMSNAIHAMPLRRETLFATNVLSGLCFAALPSLVIMLIGVISTDITLLAVPILWFTVVMLQYLFFFGSAVLSVYCVGNRFAMVLVYLILNGFSAIVYWMVVMLYEPLLYGVLINEAVFLLLCPVYILSGFQYVQLDATVFQGQASLHADIVLGSGWGYLAVCAVLGLVYMVLGLLLYRRRHLERAGDAIALRQLEPVFLVLYTLCAGAIFHGLFSLFFGEDRILFLVIGLVIGAFTCRMLLERTVKVFRKKNLLVCGGIVLAVLLSVPLTVLDPLGVVTWVPKTNSVSKVSFYTDYGRYISAELKETEDPQAIETLLQVHRAGITDREQDHNNLPDVRLFLEYTTKSGLVHKRFYDIDVESAAGQQLKQLLSAPEYVLGTTEEELDAYLEKLEMVMLGWEKSTAIPPEELRGLLLAMIADCEAGAMARENAFYSDQTWSYMTLWFSEGDDRNNHYRELPIYEGCTNTRSWLEAHGYGEYIGTAKTEKYSSK